jgi:hypothetical protein
MAMLAIKTIETAAFRMEATAIASATKVVGGADRWKF